MGTGRKREAVQGHGMDSKMRRVWVWSRFAMCFVYLYLMRHIISYHRGWRNGDLNYP